MPKQIIGVIRGVPISTGVKAGNYIFLSGQIGLVDERGNELKGIEAQTRQSLENMKGILKEVQSGKFAKEWIEENKKGRPVFNKLSEEQDKHPIEEIGRRLRRMMPWMEG